jgi:hypothetical protein
MQNGGLFPNGGTTVSCHAAEMKVNNKAIKLLQSAAL